MNDSLPPPLVPADADLRDFSWMPLEIHRLRRSKAWLLCKRRPELAFYMLNLWTAAWHDTPAGSLEDDDDMLADLAMCEPGKWPKLREHVMRGWAKADDGRLYHPVVAEMVHAAWQRKLSQRQRTEAARQAREQKRRQNMSHYPHDATTESVTESVAEDVTESVAEDVTEDVTASIRQDRTRQDRTGQDKTGEVRPPAPVGAAPPSQASPPRRGPHEPQSDHEVVFANGTTPPPSAAKAAATPRGTRLPANWVLPPDWGSWALAEYPQWDSAKLRREADSFSDHWRSKAGRGAMKLDWFATWRNWCRSDIAHRDDHKQPRKPAPSPHDTAARDEEARRLLGFAPRAAPQEAIARLSGPQQREENHE